MATLYYESQICHHGIKGQKWGVRRYQNEDGSLTSRGQKHYEKEKIKMEILREKRYDRGKKLYERGMDEQSIRYKNKIIKDSINLGSSAARTALLISGLSSMPIAAIGVATVSVGTMTYNMIQKKHTQNQIDSYHEYISRQKPKR